jgi:hypothetical protein
VRSDSAVAARRRRIKRGHRFGELGRRRIRRTTEVRKLDIITNVSNAQARVRARVHARTRAQARVRTRVQAAYMRTCAHARGMLRERVFVEHGLTTSNVGACAGALGPTIIRIIFGRWLLVYVIAPCSAAPAGRWKAFLRSDGPDAGAVPFHRFSGVPRPSLRLPGSWMTR